MSDNEQCDSRSDRSAHRFVGYSKETSGDLFRAQLVGFAGIDLGGQLIEEGLASLNIKGLILVRSKDCGAGTSAGTNWIHSQMLR